MRTRNSIMLSIRIQGLVTQTTTRFLASLALALPFVSGPHAAAQILVGSPFITGFEGWTDTHVPSPTQVGGDPSWGVLLTPFPISGQRFLM
jgi:hypothetical protein